MNNLKVFENQEFGFVRIIEENGKVLFCGSDVAKALGYAKPQNAISAHCKGALKRGTPTSSGKQEMLFITEGDVYRLIVHSKLPSAEKFESWVFDTVLPSIRGNGGYIANQEKLTPEQILANAIIVANNVINTQKTKIEEMKPKALFADCVSVSNTSILVGDLAKILKQNGVDMGAKRLFTWLRDNGYLIKRKGTDYNSPTQKSMELKLFEVKETAITHTDGHITINRTSKVNGKGQQYFVNKFIKK